MKRPHSAEYFGEQRNYWWNQDYLRLLGKRLGLGRAKLVLDIGCGIGHWGRTILPLLNTKAKMIGIDREDEWIKKATKIARQFQIEKRCQYQVGNVMKLDFPDSTFDLVTCQTLLIHLKDPLSAIKEFRRVLKPNGCLLVVEPNNMIRSLVRSNVHYGLSMVDQLNLVRFQMICEI